MQAVRIWNYWKRNKITKLITNIKNNAVKYLFTQPNTCHALTFIPLLLRLNGHHLNLGSAQFKILFWFVRYGRICSDVLSAIPMTAQKQIYFYCNHEWVSEWVVYISRPDTFFRSANSKQCHFQLTKNWTLDRTGMLIWPWHNFSQFLKVMTNMAAIVKWHEV